MPNKSHLTEFIFLMVLKCWLKYSWEIAFDFSCFVQNSVCARPALIIACPLMPVARNHSLVNTLL